MSAEFSRQYAAQVMRAGPLRLDPASHTLSGECGHVRLSRNPYLVLERLLRRSGVVVTSAQLVEALYRGDRDEPPNAAVVVRNTISRLRGLIELLNGDGVSITCEPSVGYSVVVGQR